MAQLQAMIWVVPHHTLVNLVTCNSETDSVVADCNDGYTQATGANVCCANITDALSYDEQCAATCPDGYIINSDSTACTPIICEENQYVLSFECEPCADGSYNAAGDDASQGNTTCDTIMCSSNVDPLRYPDHDCGEYGLLRSDSATIAGQTNEQCCIPFANCSELTLNAEYNTTECEGLSRGQTCTVSCNQGYYNSNGSATFTCPSENTDSSTQPSTQDDFVCEPCTQQQNCLEHSLECSTASGYENKLECTSASEGYWLNQGIATECQSTCSDGQYITTPCDGTRASDDLGCTPCQSTCSDGEYITTPCDGTTTSDNLGCTACTPIPNASVTCNSETDSVVADCNDGYTQATGANVCCANITDGII